MTLKRIVSSLFPGRGLAGTYASRTNVTTNVGSTTVTIPASGNFQPPLSNGVVRVKTGVIGVNATANVSSITVTDNTSGTPNVVNVYPGDLSQSANGNGIDRIIDFFTDVTVQQVNVVVQCANNTCTHDIEVAGNS